VRSSADPARPDRFRARRDRVSPWSSSNVYYRLAETSDPVLGAIRDGVVQALGEADAVRKDAGRLYEKTGCCAPAMLQFVQRARHGSL
jgi:hypothetical protein